MTASPTSAQMDSHQNAGRARRKTLTGAVLSEATRLNRWTFVGVGAGLTVFFAFIGTLIAFMIGSDLEGAAPAPGMGEVIDLESAQGITAGLPMAANLLGVLALSLWAAAAASDYSSGWIRVMVQAEPRRWRLLAGKFFALAGFTVVGTLLATVVAVGAAPALAGASEVSTAAWSEGAIGTIAGGWLNLTVAVLVWGIIGFAVATTTRSVVVAIAGGIGYMMVFEGVLGLAAKETTTYLPGSILGAVVAGGTPDVSYTIALGLAVAYAVAAAAIAIAVFSRRDITS